MSSVLLLSPYRSDSHAYWADWLQREFDDLDWTALELPGRHFAWRIRGNPLSWLDGLPEILKQRQPDLLLATSMVDLATIKGLHPRLAQVPTLLYFHENQFAYPLSEDQVRSIEPAMVQIYAALTAERLAFNSAFNRDSFLEGVDRLMQRMPDHVPDGLAGRLAAKSQILPVGIEPIQPSADKDPGLVLWNHRWEYDKRPDLFARAMTELADSGVEFRLALLGARGRRRVPALERLRAAIPERIVADGFLPRDDYRATLASATVSVSTAEHEFQGLSMLEATSAGAVPVVPDGLCYREQYPACFRYPCGRLAELVDHLRRRLAQNTIEAPDVSAFSGDRLLGRWREILTP